MNIEFGVRHEVNLLSEGISSRVRGGRYIQSGDVFFNTVGVRLLIDDIVVDFSEAASWISHRKSTGGDMYKLGTWRDQFPTFTDL